MATKEETIQKNSETVRPLEVENEGVEFDAEIISCKVQDGVALLEFETEASDETYVSTMDATAGLDGKSEFEKFLEQNNLGRDYEIVDNLPIECTVVTERKDDVVKFNIESIVDDRFEDDTVEFKEIRSGLFGMIAGVVPVSNVLLFGVMLSHYLGKEELEDSDVMFLFGMVVSSVSFAITVLPLVV